MEYPKAYLERLQAHLNNTKQAWCFDEFGKIWTRETVSTALLIAKDWRITEVK